MRCNRRLLVVVQDECWCRRACLNERFDVVSWRGTSLLTKGMLYLCWCLCPCWSCCSWSFVQVEWVSLDQVVWIFWLIRRKCPWWRADDVVPAVSLQRTVLLRQLQLVLRVVSSSSCEVETTYHWLCWRLLLRRSVVESSFFTDMMRDVDPDADAAERWLPNRFIEFSRCWYWLTYHDARNDMKLFAWRLKYSVDVLKLKSCCPASKVLPCPLSFLVVHLPVSERLHHLTTKSDCYLCRSCAVACPLSELYVKTSDACYQFVATATTKTSSLQSLFITTPTMLRLTT